MEIAPGVWAVGLGLYMADLSTYVVADLHIGYEQALEEQGVYLPAVQYGMMKELLVRGLEETGARRLVLLGDVKHEFGSALRQEWSETIDLISSLKSLDLELHVVRGNHDNFLIPMLRRFGVPLHDPYLALGRYVLVHGHRELPLDAWGEGTRYIVAGHEHPAIVLRDELGARVKMKCFLRAGFERRAELIVLPAFSPLMPGTEVNVPGTRFLSPLLRGLDAAGTRVYAVDLESGVYDFGTLDILVEMLTAPR